MPIRIVARRGRIVEAADEKEIPRVAQPLDERRMRFEQQRIAGL
jgi:hypothetical protein